MGNSSAKPVTALPEPPPLPGTPEALEKLKSATTLHLPGSPAYDSCRVNHTWLLDPVSFGRPSAIAVPKNAEEVAAAVKFAAETGVKLSIACGRHTHTSIVQGALMIDMSTSLNNVTVDPATRIVTVEGGATIGKVDAACAPHFLLIPMGRIGTTGCAGQMACTGAHGYAERLFGLGVDYMIAATVVVGNGAILRCSKDENADLFWGIRGGHSNFGVIVEMTFKAHQLNNQAMFYAGQYVYLPTGLFGMPKRSEIFHRLPELLNGDHPLEYSVSVTSLGGGKTSPTIISQFWWGDDVEAGKAYLHAPERKFGTVVANTMGMHHYHNEIQKWGQGPKGEDVGPGAYFFRGMLTNCFTEEMCAEMSQALKFSAPGVQVVVLLDLMGGKGLDHEGEMALPRGKKLWAIILAQWKPEITGDEGRDIAMNWVKTLWMKLMVLDIKHSDEATTNISEAGGLEGVEEMMNDTMLMGQQAKIKNVWGQSEDRMRAVKAIYDPQNVFGSNFKMN